MRWVLALGLMSLSCSCSRELRVAVNGSTIEFAVIASMDSDRVARVDLEDFSSAAFRADEASEILIFPLPPDFFRPTGAPMTKAEISTVVARLEDAPAAPGSCGRCLVPGEPTFIHPGTSCPPPPPRWVFRIDPEEAETMEPITDGVRLSRADTVRSGIRLDWPGTCGYEPSELVIPPRPIEFRLSSGIDDAMPIEVFARTSSGILGLFSRNFGLRIEPGGARVLAAELPFSGNIGSVAALSDSSFLVASRDASKASFARYDRFDLELSSTEVLGAEDADLAPGVTPTLIPVEASLAPRLGFANGAELVLIPGREMRGLTAASWVGAAFVCTVTGKMSCERITPDTLWVGEPSRLGPTDTALSSDGAVIMNVHGEVVAGRWSPQGWKWTSSSLGSVEGGATLGISGSFVLACFRRDSNTGVIAVSSLSPLDTEPRFSSWTILHQAGAFDCGDSFMPSPERDGEYWLMKPDTYVKITPAEARALELPRSGLELADSFGIDSIRRLRRFGPAAMLAESSSRSIFVGSRSSGGPVGFQRAYGSLQGDRCPDEWTRQGDALVGVDAEFLWRAEIQDGIVETSSGAWDWNRPEDIDPDASLYRVIDGLASVGDSLLIAGNQRRSDALSDPPRGWLGRLGPDDSTARDLSALSGLPRLFDIEELQVGQFVIIGDEWQMWSLSEQDPELRPIPIEWDDPMTQEIETAPPATTGCTHRWVEHASWGSIDASGGVAWAVGCAGTIAQITRVGTEFRARRFVRTWLEGAEAVAVDPLPNFEAVIALAPDHAVIAAPGRDLYPGDGQGRFWELRSASRGRALSLRRIGQANGSRDEDLGHPVSLAGTREAVVAVFDHDARIIGSEDRFYIPIDIRAAATGPAGEILLAGPGPRFILGD
ncbi:MAG: hypothetical protein HY791_17115 [Deltaproteobacteria bacterium]|nr:hypothetical protein [Deltaproteobacteria bacterium]